MRPILLILQVLKAIEHFRPHPRATGLSLGAGDTSQGPPRDEVRTTSASHDPFRFSPPLSIQEPYFIL